MQNDPLCINWDVPVAICLRLPECDERISRSFGAAEAVHAHAHTHNGSLGATAADTYSELRNTNARSDCLSKCGQYAASRAGILLFMV